jgi:paraquat-inducible protein B
MSRKANPVAVGGFVFGATILLVAAITFLGGMNLFGDVDRYSIFFSGSVNGLNRGSAVKSEGVQIGQVISIKAIAERSPKDLRLTTYTETVIEIDRSLFERRGLIAQDADPGRAIIDQGIRAQLASESLLTGQLYIAIIVDPSMPGDLVGRDPRYNEIPAIPTTIEAFTSTARSLLRRIGELPLESIVTSLDSAIQGFDLLVRNPELTESITELKGTLHEARLAMGDARGAVADARVLLGSTDEKLEAISSSAVGALDQAQVSLASLETTLQTGSPLNYQLSSAIQEVAEAARALRALMNTLEQQPNSLLFGKSGDK